MLVQVTVLVLVLGLANGQTTCADAVDPNICRLLASESFGLKDVCTDPCLARTCQKTCGKCPLQCYSCHNVMSPDDCQNIITCPSGEHNCIATESYNDNFEKVFQLGCALKDVCQRNFGGPTGKRSQLDGGCCGADLCNHNISNTPSTAQPLAGIVLTTPAATLAPNSIQPSAVTMSPTVPASSPCADFNNELCTQLAFAMPDICSNDCIASKVCPSMCGKCLSCFNCDNVQNPSDCQSTVTCRSGQRCYITETYNTMTFEHGFRTGCIDDKLCSNLTYGSPVSGSGPALIGRRSHFHLSLDGDCCGSDLCNDRVQTTQAPIATTPGPAITNKPSGPSGAPNPQVCNWNGDCPPGFHAHNRMCYNFGPTEMEWDDALGYCKERCSHLAELKTDYQLQNVMNYFRHQPNSGYHPQMDYFTGAVETGTDIFKWIWYHSGDAVSSSVLVAYINSKTHCSVVRHIGGPSFLLSHRHCYYPFRPMCEVAMPSH
ncbi:uncharacterized protein LOC110448353 isoform X2 [Mizuhopecten yessoensis]|uniref:uncharacterized protein LOC110448353 isoform X2 n=1 Tax=Mizuhopecten yessoensis TaxID=6573 RepID=UPI000B4595B8|nr:uncharacterized protein LOC110448353 isoform X2 [Mizuhopecten yessoensis]